MLIDNKIHILTLKRPKSFISLWKREQGGLSKFVLCQGWITKAAEWERVWSPEPQCVDDYVVNPQLAWSRKITCCWETIVARRTWYNLRLVIWDPQRGLLRLSTTERNRRTVRPCKTARILAWSDFATRWPRWPLPRQLFHLPEAQTSRLWKPRPIVSPSLGR